MEDVIPFHTFSLRGTSSVYERSELSGKKVLCDGDGELSAGREATVHLNIVSNTEVSILDGGNQVVVKSRGSESYRPRSPFMSCRDQKPVANGAKILARLAVQKKL